MRIFALLFLLVSLSTWATPSVLIHNGTFTPAEPGVAQVVISSPLADGNLYVTKADGSLVNIAQAVNSVHVDTVQHGNLGSVVEEIVANYSMPASTLKSAGDAIKFSGAGTFSGSDTNKRIKVYFGSAPVVDTASMSFTGSNSWKLDGECVRVASQSEKCQAAIWTSVSSFPSVVSYVATSQDLTAVVNIKIGANGTTASGIVKEIFEVLLKP